MDGNDTLGDCTIADLAHATTVYNGLLGKENIMPKASVVASYQQLTGRPAGYRPQRARRPENIGVSGSASPIVHKSNHSVFVE